MSETSKPDLKTSLDHAWAWFSLHATQRLQAVNFFLVAIAFLSAAFVTAAKEKLHAIAVGVAMLAVLIAFLFYRIEQRIRTLLKAGEDAMLPLQKEIAIATHNEAFQIVERVENSKPGEWKYSKVFRYLYWSTGCAFSIGGVGELLKLAEQHPGALSFDTSTQLIYSVFLILFGHELVVDGRNSANLPISRSRETTLFWTSIVIGTLCSICGFVIGLYAIWRFAAQ